MRQWAVFTCALLTAECLWCQQCATVVPTRGLSGAWEATAEASHPLHLLTPSLEALQAWSCSAERLLRCQDGEADERPASEFSILGCA